MSDSYYIIKKLVPEKEDAWGNLDIRPKHRPMVILHLN